MTSNIEEYSNRVIKKYISKMLILLIFISSVLHTQAVAGLKLHPSRVVFNDGDNMAVVKLFNDTEGVKDYRIQFQERIMKEDGRLQLTEKLDKNGEYASDLVLFSPRKFRLFPGDSQDILLQVNREKVKGSEYRSHLSFTEIPDTVSKNNPQDIKHKKNININISSLAALNIPVIVRKGKQDFRVELKNLKIIEKDDKPKLNFNIRRYGNHSVHGDLKVTYFSEKGEKIAIGTNRSVSVYTCINKRKIKIDLKIGRKVDLNKGKVIVSYFTKPEYGSVEITRALLEL